MLGIPFLGRRRHSVKGVPVRHTFEVYKEELWVGKILTIVTTLTNSGDASGRDPGDNGEDGDSFSDLDHNTEKFWQPHILFGPCSCLDPIDPPFNGDGLPDCPICSANQFWCPTCGGCRLCIGDGR